MQNQALSDTVKTIFSVNMNLKAGEKVLVVTDVPRVEDWNAPAAGLNDMLQRALLARQIYDIACLAYPSHPAEFLAYPTTGQNGAEPPDTVAHKLLDYEIILLITSFSLTHTDARLRACENGARIASMPGIEPDMFLAGGPLSVDYQAIKAESAAWAQKLTDCRQVHVTTREGTDLSFSIQDRAGGSDHGIFVEPGDWGNLPAGEAFTAPVEGTANGLLVVPAGWYLDLKEDMTLTFKDGYVVSVEGGGAVGSHFSDLFHFGDPQFQHRRNCAELGIGTNPNARRADNVLEAEKIRGTIHIAVGDSAHMQGHTISDVHEDFIIPSPAVYFDERKVMGT